MDSESRVLMKAFRAYLSEEEARSAVGIVAKTGGGAAGHELSDFSGAAKRADSQKTRDGATLTRKNHTT